MESTDTSGFVERFAGIAVGEFFRVKTRETVHEIVEALQPDLDEGRAAARPAAVRNLISA